MTALTGEPTLSAPTATAVWSRRSLPGRQFTPVAEVPIQDSLEELAMSLPGAKRHGLLAIREMAGPYGVADLVALVGGRELLRRRLVADVPPLLSELDAQLVANLAPHRGRTSDELSPVVGCPSSVIERRLARLRSVGAVDRKAGGFVRHPDLVPGGTVHALEAKVRDWSRGLEQALTYSLWADTSSLVLGVTPGNPAACLARGGGYRLGIFSNGRWMVRPLPRGHNQARRLWASEHLIAALRVG